MTAFDSFPKGQRRLTLMWNLVVLLFSVAAVGKAQAEDSSAPTLFFELPSLSMTLDVEKKNNALVPFQNQLKENMEEHLEEFFNNKLLTSEVGIPKLVDVDLESQLLWKELWVGPKETTEESEQAYSEINFIRKYEVKGIFNCKMKLEIEPVSPDDKDVFVSQSLINIFFLEAFENEHYWDLMHGFLTTPFLRDIISADINVLDVGFVYPYDDNGNLLFESDDNFSELSMDFDGPGLSILAIVGSTFGILFLVAISAMWYYLCFVMKGDTRFLWKKQRKRRSRSRDDGSIKGSSGTGSTNSDDSDDSDDSVDGEEDTLAGWVTANLDAWASSITSIPLREVQNKRRKKRGAKVVQRPYFRPCQEHSSSLDCITEADNESWCSSVKSSRSARSAKSNRSHKNRNSLSRTRRPDPEPSVSDVIYEDDDEDAADEEEQQEQQQKSPLIQRQRIKLLPSEDEFDQSLGALAEI